ncbi:hypothetical protein H012_gp734 [Acanthamoeba polyphaga moumouvirus]|uniref:Uncharacterized protein n=2 Tax=Moumouvirus TaxID=3080801 RepID=L7RC14_9VIRU|nr:hypothetical protein H012_gp734 [Acanthamoeba polyphaga moumouvirus]AEX63100.1 hypothetical protein mv_L898 [Moumouvirus Monve]AGC01731.1 hypothetical protein Moumou_00187 [Acanthamoeba polyphaga moumouvirus]AQN68076.1 hypothetical protein [Saudi moumouvirus]
MCWSKEISFVTFVLAMVGVIYLYRRNKPNDRWIALFAGTIAMIQLAEYFMWSDQTCGKINKYASMFALLVLAMEPLMNMIGGLLFSDTSNKQMLKYLLIGYIIFICFVLFNRSQKSMNWCGTSLCGDIGNRTNGFTINKKCNLKWLFLDGFDAKTGLIWSLFLLIPFLAMKPTYLGIVFAALGIGTFYIANITNNAAQGSLWCWFAIIIIFSKIFM